MLIGIAILLVVPLAILPPLWVWYFPHSGVESPLEGGLGDLCLDSMKHGYWFTLCLFEFSLIFAAIFPLLKKYSGLVSNIVIAVLLCIVEYTNRSNDIIYGILGLNNISMFWLPPEIGNWFIYLNQSVFSFIVALCIIAFIFPVDAIKARSPRIALLLTGIVPKNIQWERSA